MLLAFSTVLIAIYLTNNANPYVDMRIQTLRTAGVEALDKYTVGLTKNLEVSLLLFDQRNVRQKQQTLTFPKQDSAEHADLVHERLTNARWSAVHQVFAFQNSICIRREELHLPRENRIDVKLVVVNIDE